MLVFRGLHLDDATQVAFSKQLGDVEVLGTPEGPNPEIFRVTLDPAKNPAANYLRGTFDWHIDGMTEDIPIMATILLGPRRRRDRRRDRVRQHLRGLRPPHRRTSRSASPSIRVVHTIEATQRLVNPDPTDEEVAMWRMRPAKEHPLVWTHLSGRRSLVLGATTESVVGMEPAEGRAFLDDLLERSTVPDRTSTATSGPSATSSSGTTPGCCTGRSPTTRPRPATCTARRCSARKPSSDRRRSAGRGRPRHERGAPNADRRRWARCLRRTPRLSR